LGQEQDQIDSEDKTKVDFLQNLEYSIIMDYAKTSDLKPSKWQTIGHVPGSDRKVLVKSIKKYGMLHPLTIKPDGTIIDGYHRWALAHRNNIKEVPVVVVDVDDVDAMILHIQLNRYRSISVGKYLARVMKFIRMTEKYTDTEIQDMLIMEPEEFDILKTGNLLKSRNLKKYSYSKAWVPIESKTGEEIHIERRTGLPDHV